MIELLWTQASRLTNGRGASVPVGTTFEQDSTEEGLSCPQFDQHFFQSSLLLGVRLDVVSGKVLHVVINDFDQQTELWTVRGVLV